MSLPEYLFGAVVAFTLLALGLLMTFRTERTFQYYERLNWWSMNINSLGHPENLMRNASDHFAKVAKDPSQFPNQLTILKVMGIVNLFVGTSGLIMLVSMAVSKGF